VDEVDAFLDRVEATLSGGAIGSPVAAQEVHDVVFRVRFGGYDEWQVDLHLDRVERQLAELEERGGFARGPDPRMSPPPERMAPPMRDDRPMAPPMPARPVPPMPPQAAMPHDPGYGRYDEPAFGGGFDGFEAGRHGKMDMTAEIRMPDRESMGGARPGMPMAGMSPPPMGGPGPGAPGFGGPAAGTGFGAPGFGGPAATGSALAGDLQRVDQLRRTFQPRRFGSGYDPAQVDRLFEGILAAMSGRGPVSISDAELDSGQFSLVPNGYFEAEVDAALKEVRDILRRH
jgi:DivIVA domain-containing protein